MAVDVGRESPDSRTKENAIPASQLTYQEKRNLAKTPEERRRERGRDIEQAFDLCASMQTPVTVGALAAYMNKSDDTVRRHLKESKKFWISEGEVGRK